MPGNRGRHRFRDGTGIKAGVIKIGIVAKGPTALEEIGLRAAVRASGVSFDHSDDSGDTDDFLGLVRRYSLGMDHVHRGVSPGFNPSFERRAECFKPLTDAGFADKVFFSQDSEFGGSLIPEEAKEWRDKIDSPDGTLFVTSKLIPHLKQIGVSDYSIHTMTVENPRYFFSLS